MSRPRCGLYIDFELDLGGGSPGRLLQCITYDLTRRARIVPGGGGGVLRRRQNVQAERRSAVGHIKVLGTCRRLSPYAPLCCLGRAAVSPARGRWSSSVVPLCTHSGPWAARVAVYSPLPVYFRHRPRAFLVSIHRICTSACGGRRLPGMLRTWICLVSTIFTSEPRSSGTLCPRLARCCRRTRVIGPSLLFEPYPGYVRRPPT